MNEGKQLQAYMRNWTLAGLGFGCLAALLLPDHSVGSVDSCLTVLLFTGCGRYFVGAAGGIFRICRGERLEGVINQWANFMNRSEKIRKYGN